MKKSQSSWACACGTFSPTITRRSRLTDAWSTGSAFEAPGAFLNEHFSADRDGWSDGDYLRFYRGTIWIAEPAT
jgi:hypothetical protein